LQNDRNSNNKGRHLLIKLPILNEKSCYESSCHAHNAGDDILGSLIIKIPLAELDAAVQKSSTEFFSAGNTDDAVPGWFSDFLHQAKDKKPVKMHW